MVYGYSIQMHRLVMLCPGFESQYSFWSKITTRWYDGLFYSKTPKYNRFLRVYVCQSERPRCFTETRFCEAPRTFRLYVCMHVSMYVCMYVCMPMYVSMFGCMHVCMYACMYACMYVCIEIFECYEFVFILLIFVINFIRIRSWLWSRVTDMKAVVIYSKNTFIWVS